MSRLVLLLGLIEGISGIGRAAAATPDAPPAAKQEAPALPPPPVKKDESPLLPPPLGATSEKQAIEEARQHFQKGIALYNDGNFEGALAEFETANGLRASTGVLYNIGLTQKALFRYKDAIDCFQRYLK